MYALIWLNNWYYYYYYYYYYDTDAEQFWEISYTVFIDEHVETVTQSNEKYINGDFILTLVRDYN